MNTGSGLCTLALFVITKSFVLSFKPKQTRASLVFCLFLFMKLDLAHWHALHDQYIKTKVNWVTCPRSDYVSGCFILANSLDQSRPANDRSGIIIEKQDKYWLRFLANFDGMGTFLVRQYLPVTPNPRPSSMSLLDRLWWSFWWSKGCQFAHELLNCLHIENSSESFTIKNM